MIAETTELGTRFAKMVVTDEVGPLRDPDLPKAKYRVWVRGYGLVDSPKVDAEPGKLLNLTAVIAPSLKDAAQYYPAIYWAAMIKVPDRSKFPGTGPNGNGISDHLQDPRSISQLREDQRLRQLPPDRQLRDPHDPGSARQIRFIDRRLGAAPAVGAGRHHHDQQHRAADDAGRRPSRRARRLDRPHQGRRIAERNAGAADRASSAIWSSPCATGRIPSTTCTT